MECNNFSPYPSLSKCCQAMPEAIVQLYTLDLMEMMDSMHACNILHADVKPDNLLIRLPKSWAGWDIADSETWRDTGLQLIDFGRAIDLEMMPRGAQFLADCGIKCVRCIQMQEGRPWMYQVSIA